MDDFVDAVMPDEYARALPGERIEAGGHVCGTATNDYFFQYGFLFRRFSWCDTEIANAPAYSPKGEWLAVRAHWKQFKKKAAA